MDQYQEFVGKLQKRGSKPHKISHCLGSRDAFHWVRKNHWEATGGKPVDKQLYSQIVSEIHKVLVEALVEGHEIEFPYQMGSLVLVRTPSKVFYEDGELRTNYRTDWKKTLDYRYNEDPEGHQLIKRIQPFIYTVKYYKKGAGIIIASSITSDLIEVY
jgi:Na+-transporting NADH:ubiquinone oxidoreductase subunit NqrF